MAKKNTNKKLSINDAEKLIKQGFDKINFVNKNKNSVKNEFKNSINKSKGFSKPEYLEKTFNLKVQQFNHKKSMDLKNFGFKVNTANKDRELAKYKVDQKIAFEREKYNKDLAFRKEKFNTQMSMNIQNEAAKMLAEKKKAKKEAAASI